MRVFNPPSIKTALGWVRRDHRKLITVDAEVAFISGLCMGDVWEGRADRHQEPWRDTGVEIRGPAVAHAETAFAASWGLAGGVADDCVPPQGVQPAAAAQGSVSLRLIPTEPFTANLLKLDLLVSAVARRSLWITDAYFIGTGPYLEALRRAARDGVDVRLLLPQGSDVGWVVPVSRSLYRPLLEAGVRIFEWTGTMVHAKTAVVDSRWSRIGSTNLNVNSWIGNWELDVAIEDGAVARTMETQFEADLARSAEIVLTPGQRRAPARPRPRATGQPAPLPRRQRASRRVVRTVTGVGHSIGAAVSGNRQLEDFEVFPLAAAGAVLAVVALVGFVTPSLLAWPVATLAAWAGLTFVVEAWSVWRRRSR